MDAPIESEHDNGEGRANARPFLSSSLDSRFSVWNGVNRANVVHLGLHVRVAIGELGFDAQSDWSELSSILVCTVIEI
jgi:hypothetical protein